jgi:hypothetical protein
MRTKYNHRRQDEGSGSYAGLTLNENRLQQSLKKDATWASFYFYPFTDCGLNVVSCRRCIAACTSPVSVEEFTTRTVSTLVSVSTEVVTLSLKQVRW